MSNEFRNAALALLALTSMAVPAHAVPGRIGQGVLAALPSGGHLADGAFTAAPMAFNAFCDDHSDQCATAGPSEMVTLDAKRWSELEEVNGRVNRRIRPVSDAPGTDAWTLGAKEGDCDDYAVEKRKELLDRGWPSAALSLSAAFIRSGEAHLMLTVRTDRGDFVLDNLRSRVVAADRTGYRWVARQSSIHPRLWVRIDGVARETIQVAKAQIAPIPVKLPVPAPAPIVVAAARDEAPATPDAPTARVASHEDTVEHFSQVSVAEIENAKLAFASAADPSGFEQAPVPLIPIDFRDVAALFDPVIVGSIPFAATSAEVR